MIDVIPLASFRKAVKKLFSDAELAALIEFVGAHPEQGDVIPGTGGLRKLRWALTGQGRRGGSRVIYYYHRSEWQVLLLSAYAKNQKEDLTAQDKKLLARIVKQILRPEA